MHDSATSPTLGLLRVATLLSALAICGHLVASEHRRAAVRADRPVDDRFLSSTKSARQPLLMDGGEGEPLPTIASGYYLGVDEAFLPSTKSGVFLHSSKGMTLRGSDGGPINEVQLPMTEGPVIESGFFPSSKSGVFPGGALKPPLAPPRPLEVSDDPAYLPSSKSLTIRQVLTEGGTLIPIEDLEPEQEQPDQP